MQKWRWTRRIRLSFSHLFRRKDKEWRHEHIGTQGYGDGEESCCQNGLKWRKLRGAKRKTTHVCVSLALIPYINNKDLSVIYCRKDFLHYQCTLIGLRFIYQVTKSGLIERVIYSYRSIYLMDVKKITRPNHL